MFTLEEIKQLFLRHDKYVSHGYYEGYRMYNYLCEKRKLPQITGEDWTKEMENV